MAPRAKGYRGPSSGCRTIVCEVVGLGFFKYHGEWLVWNIVSNRGSISRAKAMRALAR